MDRAECGFDDVPGGAAGGVLLIELGPTIYVNIGFDPDYSANSGVMPVPGITAQPALVDTGAIESCIDSQLAASLALPVTDRRPISGINGHQEANMYLAQIYVPSLAQTMYGQFAGVHLSQGGQYHRALIGRTFLRHFVLSYNGRSGKVSITR